MKFKIKDMDIATGAPLIAIMNKKDALELDLHYADRIKIGHGKKVETAILNIAESRKAVPPGSLGVFEEVLKSLKVKHNSMVEVIPARKPLSLDYIQKKLAGGRLNKKEIEQIVWDIAHNKLNDSEIAYFVAACYTNQMNLKETTLLTKAMASQGETLKLKRYPIIDKHSVGGVPGNRTTMVIVPVIAAAGLTIPKTSSRSITSPAGTADTMEVLAPVSFSLKEMKRIVEKTNGCMVWGGALNLAPADDRIIRVERPLNIDAKSQLLASVIGKKASVSATHLLVDIPTGPTTKAKTLSEALSLKKQFEILAKELGIKIKIVITAGYQPIGNGIGPALEARDVLWILRRDKRRPLDLEKKAMLMCREIFNLVGIKNAKNAGQKALEILESGKAYRKMVEIIKAQKGSITKPEQIKIGKFSFDVKAKGKGIVRDIDNFAISKIARAAGAPLNKGAGIYLYKHERDNVEKMEKIFTIYAESIRKLEDAKILAKGLKAVAIG